jgi:hypothetical protein
VAENTVAAELIDKLLGAPDSIGANNTWQLMCMAVRLLAGGEPITVAQLAAAAGISETDLEQAIAGWDIEHDEQHRIVGWGLTLNPTPHKFSVDGKRFYTWCAPDTLIFPAVIGRTAYVESPCPKTGTIIQLTVNPDTGITDLEPSTAVVSIVAHPGQAPRGAGHVLRSATLLRHHRRRPRLAIPLPGHDGAAGRRGLHTGHARRRYRRLSARRHIRCRLLHVVARCGELRELPEEIVHLMAAWREDRRGSR